MTVKKRNKNVINRREQKKKVHIHNIERRRTEIVHNREEKDKRVLEKTVHNREVKRGKSA